MPRSDIESEHYTDVGFLDWTNQQPPDRSEVVRMAATHFGTKLLGPASAIEEDRALNEPPVSLAGSFGRWRLIRWRYAFSFVLLGTIPFLLISIVALGVYTVIGPLLVILPGCVRESNRIDRLRARTCIACRYPLRAINTWRCPECGFDAADDVRRLSRPVTHERHADDAEHEDHPQPGTSSQRA
ncbi:MAG: hypothetical protein KC983_09960 [Phycisphaerales bacterium]|nr:hypothetical protein [Phycisphaerales bacterium]